MEHLVTIIDGHFQQRPVKRWTTDHSEAVQLVNHDGIQDRVHHVRIINLMPVGTPKNLHEDNFS